MFTRESKIDRIQCEQVEMTFKYYVPYLFSHKKELYLFYDFEVNNISIYTVLNLLAIINIAILCVFLLARKNNSLPNCVLALIFIIPGLYFVDNILISTNLLVKVPYVFFLVQVIANLFPVAVYYYTHLLVTDNKKYHKGLLAGTIITIILSFLLAIDFYHLSYMDQDKYIAQLNSKDYPLNMNIYNVVFYVWQLAYLLVIYKGGF